MRRSRSCLRVPRNLTHEERALALAKRLKIEIPAQPLTSSQWVTLWGSIGKILLPIEPPEPSTLRLLWADIGMYLAERDEPEFQWGPGRRPGSKNKQLTPSPTKEAMRKRRQRERADREKY